MDALKLLVILCSFAVALSGSVGDYSGVNYYVGNWTNTGVNYEGWSPAERFHFGDSLTFTVAGGEFVVRVSREDYNSCSWNPGFVPPIPQKAHNITLVPDVGDNYYISSSEDKCKAGLKLKITVAQPPVYSPKTYTIGDDKGWSLGVDYSQWTANKKFYFGDKFRFVFNASAHTVVEVWENAYTYCNESYVLPVIFPGELEKNGSTIVTVLPGVGTHYYISSNSNDCQSGLKVELEIDPTSEAFEPSASPSGASGPSPDSTLGNIDSSTHILAVKFSGLGVLLAAAAAAAVLAF